MAAQVDCDHFRTELSDAPCRAWSWWALPAVLVIGYALSFFYPGAYGIGYLVGLFCLVRLIYPPEGANLLDASAMRVGQEQPRARASGGGAAPPRYRAIEVVLFALLPHAVFFCVRHYPLSIDAILAYTTSDGATISLFPGFVMLVLYFVPLVWRVAVRQERFAAVGLRLRRREVWFLACGLLPMIVHSAATGDLIKGAYHYLSRDQALLAALQAYYLPGLWEELYFRAFLFAMLRTRMSFLPAALLASGLFVGQHDTAIRSTVAGSADPYNLLAIFILGMAMSYVYERTRSIIACAIYHGTAVGINYMVVAVLLACANEGG